MTFLQSLARAAVLAVIPGLLFLLPTAASSRECVSAAGTLVSSEGSVQFRETAEWQNAEPGAALCQRDAVRTGDNSRAAIRLIDDAILRLDENTTIVLSEVAPEPEERSLLQLVVGAIQSFSRRPQTLAVDTPYLNATIEGTEFALRVEDGASQLTVLEGTVLAANDFGSETVRSGSAVVAEAGQAPRSVVLAEPRDAVEWALYYPPVLTAQQVPPSPVIAEAQALEAANRVDMAIDLLRRAPGGTAEQLYLAALLLSVGQVADAGAILDRVLAVEPNNGTALAQSAVIEVVSNQRELAEEKAERAVAAAPDAAAPYVALSYAQQAQFRLEDARDTLLAAAERMPEAALVQARLAEIWLTLGYRDRALAAADRALELDPNLEQAYVMRGFAALTAYRTVPAVQAFERAIALEPANPAPRLGLGLAKIREGELEAGRADIDAAVALDANRSLYRSYLGKAYFAEYRNDLAAAQFEIAKQLDPLDPTPYLYDAIRLQTENRPGEALLAIQESIERNDNRAVYRGQLLLDNDAAARGASLGRIYQDLGFTFLGQRAAVESLALDPANPSAHRFMADLYRGQRRRELARASELTRAQLLQDINLNPIQPSLTETNLNLVSQGGPTDPGFNEFTSLFLSDGIRFTGSGTLGTDDTWAGEMGFAVQDDNISVSVSGFEFRTDGFRENFDAAHSVYDVFGQIAVSPELNLQAEFRTRSSEFGDLNLDFDPDVFEPGSRLFLDEWSARFGARYSPNPRNDTLFSFVWGDRELRTLNSFDIPDFGFIEFEEPVGGDGWQAELQHIYQHDWFNLTVGGAYTDFDETIAFNVAIDGIPEPFFSAPIAPIETENWRVYAYGSVELPIPEGFGDMTLTLGGSYDTYEEFDGDFDATIDVSEFNPKVGLQWAITDDLTFRAAYLEVVKPPLVTNRTIEPTEVAGFNQYFDDLNGTHSTRYGVGLDYSITDRLAIGAEASWRELDVPFFFSDETGGAVDFTEWQEQTHRAYLYALPHPRVPVSLEFVYDRFEADSSLVTDSTRVPREVETYSVPLTVRYFDPSGVFAGVRGTYVHQEVARDNDFFGEGTSSFFNIDAMAGYRFPKQRGSATIEVSNLLDEDFEYQDDGFREFSNVGATGPYFPSLSVLGRVTVNF